MALTINSMDGIGLSSDVYHECLTKKTKVMHHYLKSCQIFSYIVLVMTFYQIVFVYIKYFFIFCRVEYNGKML